MWFGEQDIAPQAVVCECGDTQLMEGGPVGSFEALTQEEIDNLPI